MKEETKKIPFEKIIVKPFEFVLKINEHIICQRYFSVKNYNTECRESLEIKQMIDDIMSVNTAYTLGIIPEFFKNQCMGHTYRDTQMSYNQEKNFSNDKDDIFTFEVLKNNINRIRESNGDFDFEDLKKQTVAVGSFNGNLFHPNVRYEIDIRSIISDITKTLQRAMSMKNYTKVYGSQKLVRHNKLSFEDYQKLENY